jgi:hypothetical protein
MNEQTDGWMMDEFEDELMIEGERGEGQTRKNLGALGHLRPPSPNRAIQQYF